MEPELLADAAKRFINNRRAIGDLLDKLVELLNSSNIGEGVEVSLWQSNNDPGWKWAYVNQ